MVRTVTAAIGAVGLAVGSAAAWTVYQNRTTPRVPFDVVDRIDDVEIRRYPRSVAVETIAPTERTAFGRLFRYISGENRSGASVPMTAPVETDEPRRTVLTRKIPMTAPVETGVARSATSDAGARGEARMSFFLPATYEFETAPEPTSPAVHLIDVPPQTLAVHRFAWRATDRRVARETDHLFAVIEARSGLTPASDPFLLQYNGPWTSRPPAERGRSRSRVNGRATANG